jgi:hypothetical protein
MSAKWNARPAYTEKPLLGSQVSRSAAFQSVASYGGVALVAAFLSRYGCANSVSASSAPLQLQL